MKFNKILLWGASSQSLIAEKMINEGMCFIDKVVLQRPKIAYLVDPFIDEPKSKKVPLIKDKKKFKSIISSIPYFLVCIGGHHGMARTTISKKLIKLGLKPISIISSHSFIDNSVKVGKGVQVMPNSVVNCYTKIGDFSILNSSSTIDHECELGKGTHIMGGASIAGRVKIGKYVTVGTNATILPDLKIADGAYIGAGAVITKNVKKNEVIVGNPGKFIRMNKHDCDLSFF